MNFDEDAKGWDTERRTDRAKIIAKEISGSIDADNSCSAMEFGCGTGLVSFNLRDRFKNITLVDSSKGMIDALKGKINKYHIDNMTARRLDLVNGDDLDERFDVIYNSMVLHHIKNTECIIGIFYGLLNNGGYLCIADLNEEDGSFHSGEPSFDGHNGFDREKLKNVLAGAGFSGIESKTFYNGEKVVEGKNVGYSLFLMKARKRRD